MALQGLLETSTVSWGDLFGNGRRYAVPRFQRDYSWTEDEWTDLWADIDAMSEAAPVHYMGAVVLRNETDGSKGIIDGQQRLATLAVVALASIKILREWVAQGVDPEENAQRADETLNARGLELSSADLLKNYLFSKVAISAADLDRARSHWARILARVPMERLARFLFHYVSSLGVTHVTEHRLFAAVRDRVTTPQQVFDLLRDLEVAADWYAALADPDDTLWAGTPEARGLEWSPEAVRARQRSLAEAAVAVWRFEP